MINQIRQEESGSAQNRCSLCLVSIVKFLAAIGLTNHLVYGLTTDFMTVKVTAAWMSGDGVNSLSVTPKPRDSSIFRLCGSHKNMAETTMLGTHSKHYNLLHLSRASEIVSRT